MAYEFTQVFRGKKIPFLNQGLVISLRDMTDSFTFHLSLLILSLILFPISIHAAAMPAALYQNTVTEPGSIPERIAVDSAGDIYVTDSGQRMVRKYNLFGEMVMTIPEPTWNPLGIAVDNSTGDIYIGDNANKNVSVYDSSGNFLRKLGNGDGEFIMPNDIAIDPDTGNVYVTDSSANKTKVYDSNGIWLFDITNPLSPYYRFPTGIHVDSSAGELFVSVGNMTVFPGVYVYDLAGNYKRWFGGRQPPGAFLGIQGITVDSLGRIYVADTMNGLQVFDSSGLVYLGEIGASGAGQLYVPNDAILDLYDRLAVVSQNSSSIVYFCITDLRVDGICLPPDADVDGLPDSWEMTYFGNHLQDGTDDPDGDGLSNLDEYNNGTNGTDPTNPDTDGDGMFDGWEVLNSLDPLTDDAGGDLDNDGLSNLDEYNNGTDPNNADTDGDQIPDGWEVGNGLDPLTDDAGGDLDSDGLTNLAEYNNGTNPNNSDTDGDGMPDGWEVTTGLDPAVYDASGDLDGDGLSNLDEYNNSTDPNNSDTDSDGMPDGWEIANGLNPNVDDASGDPDGDGLNNLGEYNNGTDLNNSDTDSDGMPDGWEVANGLDPLRDDADEDADGDGFTNYEEYIRGTDPQDASSGPVPTIIYVDDDNTAGPWDGSNNTPYRYIQDAIDYSISGDTIKVARGLYQENLVVTTIKKFTMEGGWDSAFAVKGNNPAVTIIDGGGNGSVFYISVAQTMTVDLTIKGFTLTNGSSGTNGGAVYLHSNGSAAATLAMSNNIINGNSAFSGGGISVSSTTSSAAATLTLTNNIIAGNTAINYGGGIYASSNDSSSTTLTMTNNTLTGNKVTNVQGYGGGIYASSDNNGSTTITMVNDIVWGNITGASADDLYLRRYSGNTTSNVSYTDIGSVVNNNAIYNDLVGNLNSDPLFVDSSNANYHLTSSSTLRDNGTVTGAPSTDFEGDPRPWGAGVDIGADEYINSISLNLTQGWNLISIPIQPDDTSIEAVLASISGDYRIVWGYDSSGGRRRWRRYKPGGNYNTLTLLEPGRGYWILMTEDAVLEITGGLQSSVAVQYSRGWNLIGLPGITDRLVDDALSSLKDANGDPLWSIIWGYNGDWHGRRPNPSNGPNSLTILEVGKGYWIKMTEAVEWTP